MQKVIVPDTSVIIDGFLSKEFAKLKSKPRVIIHEAVLAELESQANKRRETGYVGLEEIKKLRKKAIVEYDGTRPKEFEIKFAKSGEIDSLIRDLAGKHKATLYTADIVQGLVAEAKGIKVKLFKKNKSIEKTGLEKYFSKDVMSIHLKEGCKAVIKKGRPGSLKLVKGKVVPDLLEMGKFLIGLAKQREDSYIDSDSRGSTILQIGEFRIVINRPPFSDSYEITVVRPVRKLSLKDYNLSKELLFRFDKGAEGILIAGSPGSGKSTFAQSLIEHYSKKDVVIKTIESPRDLNVDKSITQYALKQSKNEEVRDIFLLSRPDVSVFDEVRNDKDFELFSDLRLSGVGMIGVIHSTKAIDALQRFIQRIDLGVIPNVVDTLIFIEDGKVSEVYSVTLEVKVPYGMTEIDLARPIVGIHDFYTGLLKYEVYSYGDSKIVMPVGDTYSGGVLSLARKHVEKELTEMFGDIKAYVLNNKILVHAKDAKKFFIDNSRVLKSLEKRFGMKLDVKQVSFSKEKSYDKKVNFDFRKEGNNIYFIVKNELTGKDVDFFVENDFVLTAKVGKGGKIKFSSSSAHAKLLLKSLKNHEKVELRI